MNIDACYRAGYVVKKHGFRGELRIHFDHTPPKKLESIFLQIDGMLVPFFIRHLSIGDPYSVIKLDDVDTERDAEQLTQKEIYLPNSIKPKKQRREADLVSLIGFDVFKGEQPLGKVANVQDHHLNPLLIIDRAGKELLIPVNDHFIIDLNHKTRTMQVQLPEGFLDI
ncbi:MAG: ribosome maturation factor RimM [Cyclobacteriaceae bacterium]